MHSKAEIPEHVMRALEELLKGLRRLLGDFHLYLFGSYAKGNWLHESDVDIVVVSKKFEGMPRYERSSIVRRLADPKLSFEILCYTPEEVRMLVKESTFLKDVSRHWVKIGSGKSSGDE